jgi:2-dehydropantoate 2-reductase
VRAYTHDAAAILDIGRWPGGTDGIDDAVAAAFTSAGFESVARPDIPRWKYAKLLLNLTNPIDALCPRDDAFDDLSRRARQEGEAVLDAAGIPYVSHAEDRERRGDILRIVPIDARTRPGASTWQSLARGLPVEVDHLNGEIVLLGRLHGVAAPVNELLQAATHQAVAARTAPGSIPAADLLARLG